ncbi:hypothetical protein KO116_03475 [Halomonas sp. KO116]|nr:hypothetical protein KO116_03475 [Halomonas sp. KO116]
MPWQRLAIVLPPVVQGRRALSLAIGLVDRATDRRSFNKHALYDHVLCYHALCDGVGQRNSKQEPPSSEG